MYSCVPLNSITVSVLFVGIISVVVLFVGIIFVEFVDANTSIISISFSSGIDSVVVLFCNPKINGSVCK